MRSSLTFKSDATYDYTIDSVTGREDTAIADGVTINSGALFSFADVSVGTLPHGTVLIAIDNTAATAITGTFDNLSDGSTFTVNGNTFQASYEGGDGNDLNLTVR